MSIQQLLTLDDLAKLLGRSPDTIKKDMRRNPDAVPCDCCWLADGQTGGFGNPQLVTRTADGSWQSPLYWLATMNPNERI